MALAAGIASGLHFGELPARTCMEPILDLLTRNILKGLSRKRQTSAGGSAGRMASSGVSASSPSISIRLGPALRSIIIENIQYCTEMSNWLSYVKS